MGRRGRRRAGGVAGRWGRGGTVERVRVVVVFFVFDNRG